VGRRGPPVHGRPGPRARGSAGPKVCGSKGLRVPRSAQGLAPAIQTRPMDVAGATQTLAEAVASSALNIVNSLGALLGGTTIAAGFGFLAPTRLGLVLVVLTHGCWSLPSGSKSQTGALRPANRDIPGRPHSERRSCRNSAPFPPDRKYYTPELVPPEKRAPQDSLVRAPVGANALIFRRTGSQERKSPQNT